MTSQSHWLTTWLPSIAISLLPLAFAYGFATTTDLLLVAGFTLSRNRTAALRALKVHENNVWVLSGVLSGSAALYYLFRSLLKRNSQTTNNKGENIEPLFFPCGTTHTRTFPEKHSFTYSYLLAGFKVGWQGSVGGLLSVDGQNCEDIKDTAKDWFVVDAGDYLERGHGHLGLQGKLHKYLQSQDVDPSEYPYAYLVTVPKLLGYSFNPVSFWYLYSSKKELSAMVLEVNNTFDERRPYFLKIDENQELTPEELSNTNGASRKPTRFTNTWTKDFHVSPFNSRKGAYSLIAYDPLFPHMTGTGPIDNTITLLSSKAHPKIIARVFSKGNPVNPSGMGFIRRMTFLSSWWWVVYATAIRTVKEAFVLYFSHGLHVWLRPEVLKTSIGRKADRSEQELEVFFRRYLSHLVKSSEANLQVIYTPAGIPGAIPEKLSSPSSAGSELIEELEFKVLTPLFYNRFIHYAHDSEALFSEFTESGTIWLSNPPLLEYLLSKPSLKTPEGIPLSPPPKRMRIYLWMMQRLRKRPDILSISQSGKKAEEISTTTPITTRRTTNKGDIRKLPLSGMDRFILEKETEDEQRSYLRLVVKLFISDRIALGSLDVLWLEFFVVRCIGAWVVARWLSGFLLG